MSIKTDAFEARVINTMRGTALAAWTPWVALLSAVADAETPSVTEVTGANGLTRQSATFGAPNTTGDATTTADLNFGTYSGAGVTVTHVAIYDASTAGEARYIFALTASKTLATSDPVSILTGNLTVGER